MILGSVGLTHSGLYTCPRTPQRQRVHIRRSGRTQNTSTGNARLRVLIYIRTDSSYLVSSRNRDS